MILTIALLTLREAARRRLVLAVVLLTAAVVAFAGWGLQHLLASLNCGGPGCSPVEARTIAATLLILVVFMLSFVFSLAAVFVAAPAIAADIESGIAFAILPRPIRRSDLVLGKWLGLTALIGAYTVGTTGLLLIVVAALTGYAPPHPLAALAFLAGEAIVLLMLTLLGSTRLAPMTCGIVVLVLFGVAWIGGIAEGVGIAVNSASVTNAGLATSLLLPTDGLWRGALYSLEPAALLATEGSGRAAAANPFLVTAPPSGAYLIWAAAWMALVLALAVLSLSRREI